MLLKIGGEVVKYSICNRTTVCVKLVNGDDNNVFEVLLIAISLNPRHDLREFELEVRVPSA